MQVTVIPATAIHAKALAENLRAADRLEALDFCEGRDLREVIAAMVEASEEAWTAVCEEGVICMGGCSMVSHVPAEAEAWLLTSPLVERIPKHFTREIRGYLNRWLSDYEIITIYIDERYTQAVAWAVRALKFRPTARAWVANRAPFRAYELMRMH